MSNIIDTSNFKKADSKGNEGGAKYKDKVLIRSNIACKPVLRDYIPGYTKNLSDNIIFLGTGAADWPEEIPAGEEYLPNRNWRRQSSAIINQHILIDCGPTVPGALKV
jgi:hypothetical protein